jgi:hypothetical protein
MLHCRLDVAAEIAELPLARWEGRYWGLTFVASFD